MPTRVNIKSFFVRFWGPLDQTHTHKPREGVRGRRTQSSSHLTTEPRYFDISHLVHRSHRTFRHKSLQQVTPQKVNEVSSQASNQNKNNRQPRVETFPLLLQATTQPVLREAHIPTCGSPSSRPVAPLTEPPQPYPISYGTERRALHRTCIKEGGVSPRTHIVGTPKVGPHTSRLHSAPPSSCSGALMVQPFRSPPDHYRPRPLCHDQPRTPRTADGRMDRTPSQAPASPRKPQRSALPAQLASPRLAAK
jgi:hypothetical protein